MPCLEVSHVINVGNPLPSTNITVPQQTLTTDPGTKTPPFLNRTVLKGTAPEILQAADLQQRTVNTHPHYARMTDNIKSLLREIKH